MSPARVAAVVVQYADDAPCRSCLESLARSDGVECIPFIADNNPRPSEALRRLAEAAGGRYLHFPENRGFAAGANGAIRAAHSFAPEVIAVLNPDVRVAPDCLRLLRECLAEDLRIGIAGPVLLSEGEPETCWNAGSEIAWPSSRPRSLLHGKPCGGTGTEGPPRDVGFVCGSLLAFRTALAGRLGAIPERYFLYFEDAEYSFSAREAGLRVVVVPGARAWHRGGGSTGSSKDAAGRASYYRARNRLLFSRSWCPRRFPGLWHRVLFGAGVLSRCFLRYGRSLDRSDLLPARAVLDYARGRTGKLEE